MSAAASPNPYVGLRPFQTADAAWFFGRDRDIARLARKISSNHFTAVVGASGSGKSSLVLAGVLPQLAADGWQALDTKPGAAPIARLAAALAPAVGREDLLGQARRFRIDASLRRSAFGLADVVASMAPNTPPIILVVDQFEELFRYGEGMVGSQGAAMCEEGRAFVELLLTATQREGSRLHVVLTMRWDYFGNCAAYQGLAEAVSASLYLVSIPNRDQLEAAIRRPVAKAGATIDDRLVQRLLVEVEEEADRLPLLQHCLMRLWQQASVVEWPKGASEPTTAPVHFPSATCVMSRRFLDLSNYPGLRESLSAHADEILTELERQNSAYPRVAEFLFRALTEIDNQGRPIRRPRTMAELTIETGADPAVLQQVIGPFRRHDTTFLTPYGDEPLDDNDVVDISHEALIRSWRRINDPTTDVQTGWPRGWLQREEKDGRRWRSLLFNMEMRMQLPADAEFRRWLGTLPGSGWAERHGGNWEAVREIAAPRSTARIEFEVLNGWLDKGVEQEITIQVANRDTADAEGFWLEISVRDGTGHEIARPRRITESTLPPGPLRPHLTLPVRAEGPAAVLTIDYGHRGEPGPWHEERVIEVREVPQRLWSMLATPYEAGAPVFGPGRFFGRQTELNDIFSVLVAGITQPILLRSPRRMGKTSMMKQIEYLLTHPERLHDYDVLRPDQINRLGTIRPVYLSLQALSESGRIATDQFFAAVLDDAAEALGHPGADWPVNDPDPVRTFRRALGRLLDAEAAAERRRLLIMVDEWDETSRPEFRDLGIRLRWVMIDEQRVNWIIASTWIMRHEELSSSSPLHNMCHTLEIKAAGWKTAVQIVEGRARLADLHWHSHAMVAALEQTGQWPYLIQMLGAGAVKLINDYRLPPVVELKTVQEVLGQIVSGKLPDAAAYFRSIFARDDQLGDDRDTVRTIGWLILWVLNEAAPEPLSWQALDRLVEQQAPIAVRNRPDWRAWYGRELHDQIALLHEAQYMIEQDEHECYRFRVPVFRDWFDATKRHLHEQMRERLTADLDRGPALSVRAS